MMDGNSAQDRMTDGGIFMIGDEVIHDGEVTSDQPDKQQQDATAKVRRFVDKNARRLSELRKPRK